MNSIYRLDHLYGKSMKRRRPPHYNIGRHIDRMTCAGGLCRPIIGLWAGTFINIIQDTIVTESQN